MANIEETAIVKDVKFKVFSYKRAAKFSSI